MYLQGFLSDHYGDVAGGYVGVVDLGRRRIELEI